MLTTITVSYYQERNEMDVPVWRFDVGEQTGINTPAFRETLALRGANREQVDTFLEVLRGIECTIRPYVKHLTGFPVPA